MARIENKHTLTNVETLSKSWYMSKPSSDEKQLLLALSDDDFVSTKIKGAEILSDSEIQMKPTGSWESLITIKHLYQSK